MTPAEKAGQLTQYFYFSLPSERRPTRRWTPDVSAQPAMVEAARRPGRAGSLLFVTDPAEINRLQRLAVDGNRLGIPALFGFDVIHGLRTILPVPIAMAASWDPETIEQGQAVAAREARAVGIHWTFAPMVDIARDPRWGRMIEGAGEDPYLGAAVAVAQVRGFQGRARRRRTGSSPARSTRRLRRCRRRPGLRRGEPLRLRAVERLPARRSRRPSRPARGNIMTAYMDLNGIPATGNHWLLHRGAAGDLGVRRLRGQRRATRCATCSRTASPPTSTDAGVRAVTAGVRPGDGDHRAGVRDTCPRPSSLGRGQRG